jgi:hypothetical protein
VGRHHAKGLLDTQMKGAAHALGNVSARARRRLTSELPACASPSSTSWQSSRAAACNSSNSYCEEL